MHRVAFVCWLAVCTVAHAQEHARLDFASSAPACADESRLIGEVAAATSYAPFDAGASRVARVRVLADGSELVATLELDSQLSRAFRGADCNELLATVARAIASELRAASSSLAASVPAAPDVDARRFQFRVRSNVDPLGVYELPITPDARGWSRGVPICASPCTADLAARAYNLEIAVPDGRQLATIPMRLDQPTDLDLTYVSHSDERLIGAIVFLASIVAAPILVGVGVAMASRQHVTSSDWSAPVATGLGVGAVGIGVGLTLMGLRDHLEIAFSGP